MHSPIKQFLILNAHHNTILAQATVLDNASNRNFKHNYRVAQRRKKSIS